LLPDARVVDIDTLPGYLLFMSVFIAYGRLSTGSSFWIGLCLDGSFLVIDWIGLDFDEEHDDIFQLLSPTVSSVFVPTAVTMQEACRVEAFLCGETRVLLSVAQLNSGVITVSLVRGNRGS